MGRTAGQIERDVLSGLECCGLAAEGLWARLRRGMEAVSPEYGRFLWGTGDPMDLSALARVARLPGVQHLLPDLTELADAFLIDQVEGVFYAPLLIELAEVRAQAAARMARYRESGGGDPHGWNAIRHRILKRDGAMCAYCGSLARTVDHVVPRSRGGSHDDANLVACCWLCNSRKCSRTPDEAGMVLARSVERGGDRG